MAKDKKAKSKRGRPRRFDAKAKDCIVDLLRAGQTRTTIAKVVGFSITTIANECQRDPDFLDRVMEAEGLAGGELEQTLHNAALKDPKYAVRVLESKYPKDWGRVNKHAVTDSQGRDLTASERAKAISAIFEEKFGVVMGEE